MEHTELFGRKGSSTSVKLDQKNLDSPTLGHIKQEEEEKKKKGFRSNCFMLTGRNHPSKHSTVQTGSAAGHLIYRNMSATACEILAAAKHFTYFNNPRVQETIL